MPGPAILLGAKGGTSRAVKPVEAVLKLVYPAHHPSTAATQVIFLQPIILSQTSHASSLCAFHFETHSFFLLRRSATSVVIQGLVGKQRTALVERRGPYRRIIHDALCHSPRVLTMWMLKHSPVSLLKAILQSFLGPKVCVGLLVFNGLYNGGRRSRLWSHIQGWGRWPCKYTIWLCAGGNV